MYSVAHVKNNISVTALKQLAICKTKLRRLYTHTVHMSSANHLYEMYTLSRYIV